MVFGAVLATGLVLAAWSSGSPSATDPTTTTSSPVTTSTTSPRVTTTTVLKPAPTPRSTTTTTTAAADPVTAAITAFQAAQGPARGWVISSTQASAVDPSYILFKLRPAPGYETSYQGGYGFVQHQASGTWSVIGFGTFGVGCPSDGSTAPAVPAQVLSGFGVSCSS